MGLLVTLMILGIILILTEIFIIPGVGFAGIAGFLCMGGSTYYAFYEFGTTAGYSVLGIAVLVLVLLTVFALRAKTWEKATLKTNIDSKALPDDAAVVHKGDVGRTHTRLAPMGTVRFGEYFTEAKSLEGMIDPGVDVKVVLIEDNKIYVTPANLYDNI